MNNNTPINIIVPIVNYNTLVKSTIDDFLFQNYTNKRVICVCYSKFVCELITDYSNEIEIISTDTIDIGLMYLEGLKTISNGFVCFASTNYSLGESFLESMVSCLKNDSCLAVSNISVEKYNGKKSPKELVRKESYSLKIFLKNILEDFDSFIWDISVQLFNYDFLKDFDFSQYNKSNFNKWVLFDYLVSNLDSKKQVVCSLKSCCFRRWSEEDFNLRDEFDFRMFCLSRVGKERGFKDFDKRLYKSIFYFLSRLMVSNNCDLLINDYRYYFSKLFNRHLIDLKIIKARVIFILALIKYLIRRKRVNKQISKIIDLNRKKEIHFVMLGTPDHGNLGDNAIVLSEIKVIKELNKKSKIIEFQTIDYYPFKDAILSSLDRYSIAIIDGGGNLGTLWKNENRRIMYILENVKKSKIIMFPETIYYAKESNDELFLLDKTVLNNANCLYFLREEMSYTFFEKYLSGTNHYCVPDIVFSYCYRISKHKNHKVALIFRTDKEKTLSNEAMKEIEHSLEELGYEYDYLSTISSHSSIKKFQRKRIVSSFLHRLSKYDFVITDRLHAMIFAYINNTKCFAFDNVSKKISGSYQWIKHNENYNVFDDYDSLLNRLKQENESHKGNNDMLDFTHMKNIIKKWIGDCE